MKYKLANFPHGYQPQHANLPAFGSQLVVISERVCMYIQCMDHESRCIRWRKETDVGMREG